MVSQIISCCAPRPAPLWSSSSTLITTSRSPALILGLRSRPCSGTTAGVQRILRSPPSASMLPMASPLVHDVFTSVWTAGVALGLLRFWEEVAKMGVFDQKLNRKLVHISIGLAFMLFWPMYSSEIQAPFLAAIAPGVNIIRMLLMGLGIWRNEAMVKSISRYGDYRELLKGPLYYACTIALATTIFWRTSPIAIAAICNLCAGDGIADIIGRRFGVRKLPYNLNKSFAGSIAMATAGFVASVGYMHYYSLFGFMEESWGMTIRFLIVSLAAALVESLPISSEMDDNLTKLNRKLVHITAGLAFMLMWPLFSYGSQAPYMAALTPTFNIIQMLLIGLGIWRDEATVKSMSRLGDYRELLKGPLYYACTLTVATSMFWRTSPIAIAAICNLCAGDGVADIVGRRLGVRKLPYNLNKSFAGSIAMAISGFVASIGYMHYNSLFGFMDESWDMTVGFLVVSLASALVESLPISSEIDDNLTVPLTSMLVGSLVF